MEKQFGQILNTLHTQMREAATLKTKPEQQGFINRSFLDIHKAYKEKQVNHDEYIKLVNTLAAFHHGAFNDYLDLLSGAASMGMSQFSPEAARGRSQTVTDMTGVEPVEPE